MPFRVSTRCDKDLNPDKEAEEYAGGRLTELVYEILMSKEAIKSSPKIKKNT